MLTDLEFLYNADETGHIWEDLSKTILPSERKSNAPGHKVNKDREPCYNVLTLEETTKYPCC